ncbi:MAG TPA: TIGR02206 family membrane protein [Candidatus Nesterenkonia stercoripullorum]|uniref:TIGR02206 family membrane protein n=1 Tax=Candidatus Nesterenkonia stercoripullorum TaxID=2838701 RepID=A0A9D1UT81_9MICC|nr:TIGR02206 family membrane protein [Candidatus Nesterenkonia stercoripullorum]
MDPAGPDSVLLGVFGASSGRLEHWSPEHIAVLGLTCVGAVLLVWWGRRTAGMAAAKSTSRVLAMLLLVVTVAFQVYWLLPARFELEKSLPLHFSDVLRVIVIYALWTRRPWAVAVTFYWGLTLNIQPMLTPDVNPAEGSYLVEFASFWAPHVLVMWAPLFLLAGFSMRPTWRGYVVTLAITVLWAAVAFGANLLLGTNYGYLNAKPPGASLLDVLGPWPVYLLVELLAVIVVWALLTAAFRDRGRGRAASGRATAEPQAD